MTALREVRQLTSRTTEELHDLLLGEAISADDREAMHAALTVLCGRVAELVEQVARLEQKLEGARRSAAASANIAGCLANGILPD